MNSLQCAERTPWTRLVRLAPVGKTALRRWLATGCMSLLAWAALPSAASGAEAAPPVRLNTLGYLPTESKRASLVVPGTNFQVIRVSDGVAVLSGFVTGPITNEDTRQSLYSADFSAVTQPGQYRIEATGAGASDVFTVATNLYHAPFCTVMRGMYLWRCGTAVSGTHEGKTFAHGACHTNDAWLDAVGGAEVRSNSTGGWHDAGDYNKYVVNAGITVGTLLRAWEDFGPQIRRVRLDLPEAGRATPEFLSEIRWELDWLLTMQAPDGAVHHKVSTREFGPFILPERETARRYFVPWSSAATADFVAMMAMAARSFREFDPAFADRCLSAARRSWEFLKAHPENHAADQSGFATGRYPTRDDDDRLWAAAELWATTGEPEFLREFERRATAMRAQVDRDWDWGNVKNLGLLTYLFAGRAGRDEVLVKQLRESVLAAADGIVETRDRHGYARPLGTRYNWGCNGSVARQSLVLQAARKLAPRPAYREAQFDALNYLFGRNSFGRSFVTGLGARPPLHPHDRRSGGDDVDAPWPGYLVGGPNPQADDWRDVEVDFRTNEIAINWNAALIYALAAGLE